MEAEMFGWREVILLLVGVAAVYWLISVIRLLRIGKRPASPGKLPPPLAEAAAQEPALPPELVETTVPLPVSQNTRSDAVDRERPASPASHAGSAAQVSAPVSGFGEKLAEHLARSDLEREVRRLHKDVEQLRAAFDDLRAMRNISPHYAEAMTLVQRGLSAQEVADRMGISLAEAELVYALSRGESLFEEGEHDGTNRDDRENRNAGDSGVGHTDIGFKPRRGF